MNAIEKLTEKFKKFPGIGERQAKRFVYFLLRQPKSFDDDLIRDLAALRQHVRLCRESFMYFYADDPKDTLSPIARDPNRDTSQLMIVEKDTDLESIERSDAYHGKYFVLGGNLPIGEQFPEKRIRIKELLRLVEQKSTAGLAEIILALSANPEGEYTAHYIKEALTKQLSGKNISMTILGRGLSTGTELEYSDSETIKNALTHRTK